MSPQEVIELLGDLRDSLFIPEDGPNELELEDWDHEIHPYKLLDAASDTINDLMGDVCNLYKLVSIAEIRKDIAELKKPKVRPHTKAKAKPKKKEPHMSEAQKVAEIRRQQMEAAKAKPKDVTPTDRLSEMSEEEELIKLMQETEEA
jgi:hypothetical protein